MPVHSTKRVAPPFALLDDEGRVQAYVTPVPGLNLRRYTKKYVGIIGEKTYVSSLPPHTCPLNAQSNRISDLANAAPATRESARRSTRLRRSPPS